MLRPREISRVIVVVLDGLRPDAIALYGLRHIWRLSQQGGGGAWRTHHNSDHRHDRNRPIMVVGGAVTPGALRRSASLLDVPATVAWALGLTPPASYAGSPLTEAFLRARRPELAVASA